MTLTEDLKLRLRILQKQSFFGLKVVRTNPDRVDFGQSDDQTAHNMLATQVTTQLPAAHTNMLQSLAPSISSPTSTYLTKPRSFSFDSDDCIEDFGGHRQRGLSIDDDTPYLTYVEECAGEIRTFSLEHGTGTTSLPKMPEHAKFASPPEVKKQAVVHPSVLKSLFSR